MSLFNGEVSGPKPSFFAGLWEAIPTEQPDLTKDGCCVAIHPVTYDRVVVSGCVATLSMTGGGGPAGGGHVPQTKVTMSKSNTTHFVSL